MVCSPLLRLNEIDAFITCLLLPPCFAPTPIHILLQGRHTTLGICNAGGPARRERERERVCVCGPTGAETVLKPVTLFCGASFRASGRARKTARSDANTQR